MMKTIPLTQGKVALVDDNDFENLNQFKWFAIRQRGCFYAARAFQRPDGKWVNQRMHQFLIPGAARIDHRDGNGLNNQRYNLRPATNRQNLQGFQRKAAGSTSKFRGVSWQKECKKWEAQIQVDGKKIHLGLFELETDAAKAYDAAAIANFGEFAAPNFP